MPTLKKSEILKKQGFETQVGMIVQGNCVTHEIDVIAKKENKVFVVECKYHNLRGIFCDVKIPLYINSRFLDVEKEWLKTLENKSTVHQGWLVTNTRFSSDAIQYGVCAGLKLLGWDYPVNESLKDQIDALGLYPITCLTSLTKTEKQRLLDMKIVMCSEISNNEKLLLNNGVRPSRVHLVMKEAQKLCKENIESEGKISK